MSPTIMVMAALTATSTSGAPVGDYEVDPVVDAAIIGSTLGFAVILQSIIQTGELLPQPPVDPSVLIRVDRWRAESDFVFDKDLSNIGLAVLATYLLYDVIAADLFDRPDAWYEHLVIYAESLAITLAITDLTKMAIRRPRPSSYRDVRNGNTPTSTDRALSFISGHASMSAAIASTAAYFAWIRGDPVEKWVVTLAGGAVAALVASMRVVEGKHFPTDVLAGSLVGAGVGVLVPHLHRTTGATMGVAPTEGGAVVQLGLTF